MTPEQRLEAFRKFVERSPDDPFARYSLAMGHRAAGQPEQAAREFEELARRAPAYVPTYLMWGQALEGLDRHAEAVEAYERGIEVARGAGNDHALSELSQARDALRAPGGQGRIDPAGERTP